MGDTTIGGGITKNIHELPSACSAMTLPLKQSNRVNCSLDFLAAIAYEHAKSAPQLETELSLKQRSNNEVAVSEHLREAEYMLKPKREPSFDNSDSMDVAMTTDIDDIMPQKPAMPNAINPSIARVHARAATKYAEAAERHAAAALAMAGHSTRGVVLEKTPQLSRLCSTRQVAEDYASRGRRLQQNQVYRKKLRERGVHPVKLENNKFKCSLCDKVFDKEMFVWRHGVKHLGLKPFQCTLCLSTFNRSDSLQRHVRNFHLQDTHNNPEAHADHIARDLE